MMRSLKRVAPASVVLVLAAMFFLGVKPAESRVPEARSGGKFFESKGTEAAEGAEEAARPLYEYGKGLQFGSLHVIPAIDYRYTWDNNIFLEESGRRSDYYHAFLPSVTAELPINGGQHVVSAFGSGEIEEYRRFDDQDHEDFAFGGGAELHFVPFSLAADARFSNTVDRADTEFTDRVERDETEVHALLEIPFASFFLETEPYYYEIDYDTLANETFDHEDITIFQRVGMDISPRTQVLAEYGYKTIDYTRVQNRDGDSHQGMLGLRGYWTELIVYQAWVGYASRVYELDESPDYHGVIFRSSLNYQMSETSLITLKADRDAQESTFDGQSFYVRNRFELGWKKQLAERIFFNTREMVSFNEYSRNTTASFPGQDGGHTRRDAVWETGLGLEYRFPNDLVSLFTEYRYRARESNTGPLGYDGQSVSLGVRASF